MNLPGTAVAAAVLAVAPAPASAADTVFLRNGRSVECEVTGFTDTEAVVRYQAAPGTGWRERRVPLAEIEGIDFAPLPGEVEARAEAVRTGSPDPLLPVWVKRLPWIDRPRCTAGDTGLLYAELLSRRPTADRIARALEVYRRIESSDWSEERRLRAKAGRLRLMLRQGKVAEVRPQAERLLTETGDPRVVIDLHHVLAEAAEEALVKLETDHPRWQEEDEIVPERDRLLNEALDGYLFGHLFHGAEEDLAARGLWAAVTLCRTRDSDAARDWADDLTRLYPEFPEAAAAREWLEERAGNQDAGPAGKPAARPRTAAPATDSKP